VITSGFVSLLADTSIYLNGCAMAIPLYGFLEGDTIGLLLLAEEDDSLGALADKLQAAADLRVIPRVAVEFVFQGRILNPILSVKQASLAPLDRFDVRSSR
jgi:hypothetical protein